MPAGRRELLLIAHQIDFCAQGRQFLLWIDAGPCREVTSEAKKQNGKRRGDDRDSNTTFGHRYGLPVRQLNPGSVLDRRCHGHWKGNEDAAVRCAETGANALIPRLAVGRRAPESTPCARHHSLAPSVYSNS